MSVVSFPNTSVSASSDRYVEAQDLVMSRDGLAFRAYDLPESAPQHDLVSRFKRDPGRLLSYLRPQSKRSSSRAGAYTQENFTRGEGPFTGEGAMGHILTQSSVGPTGLVHKADFIAKSLDPEPCLDYALYWNNLHSAVSPMPPLLPRNVNLQNMRFLPFTGFSEDTISLAGPQVCRYAPTPFLFDRPGLVVLGASGAGLAGPSAAATFELALEQPIATGTGYSTRNTTPAATIATVTQTTFVNTTMANEGYSSLAAFSPPDVYTQNVAMGEFSGGFALIKVIVANGAQCQISIAGQNQTRGLGFFALHEELQRGTLASIGATNWDATIDSMLKMTDNKAFANNVDFEFNTSAATLGLLSNIVSYDEVVSGADQTVERYYAMPILPPGPNVTPLTPDTNGTDYTAGEAIWQRHVGNYGVVPSNLAGTWSQATISGVNWYQTTGGAGDNAPYSLNGTTGGSSLLGWNTVGNTRVCRAAGIGQTLMAGMPQFECVRSDSAAGGSASVVVSQKLFYNMINAPTDANWSVSRAIGKYTSTAAESIRNASAMCGGRGPTAADAVKDAKKGSAAIAASADKNPHVIQTVVSASNLGDTHISKPAKLGNSPPEGYSQGLSLKKLGAAAGSFISGAVGKGVGNLIGEKAPKAVQALGKIVNSQALAGAQPSPGQIYQEAMGESITDTLSGLATDALEFLGFL